MRGVQHRVKLSVSFHTNERTVVREERAEVTLKATKISRIDGLPISLPMVRWERAFGARSSAIKLTLSNYFRALPKTGILICC